MPFILKHLSLGSEWWPVVPLNIDHSKLTAIADLLDAAIAAK